MDPFTLLAAGPALIRMVGGLFGGHAAETANKVADVVDTVRGLPPAAQKQKLEEHLAQLPPESLVALKQVEVRLAEIAKDREANRLQADTAQHHDAQETARVEQQSGDAYVRRTRPGLARKSAYATFAYALITGLLFPVVNAFYQSKLPGPDPIVLGAMFSPCLAYMGVRTLDGFARKGKTN